MEKKKKRRRKIGLSSISVLHVQTISKKDLHATSTNLIPIEGPKPQQAGPHSTPSELNKFRQRT